MNAKEIYQAIVERLEYSKAVVQVSAGADKLSQNQNRKTTGNRVVFVMKGSVPGKPFFRDPLNSYGTRAYKYEVHIWGFAGLQASREEHYLEVQKLSALVAQAFFPLGTRHRFSGGEIEEETQNQPGAHLVDTYEVDHDIARLNGPNSEVENKDYTEFKITKLELTKG